MFEMFQLKLILQSLEQKNVCLDSNDHILLFSGGYLCFRQSKF